MPSRIEQILENMLGAGNPLDPPQSRIEELLIEILESGGGGGGGGGGTAGVTSFNGRRGTVRPQAGDYSAALIGTAGGSTVQAVLNELVAATELDSALSTSSQKAVKNSVITTEMNRIAGRVLPAAGATGAVLVKSSTANYATEWKSQGDFMLKTDYDPGDDGKVDLAEKAEAVKGPTYKATLTNKGRDTTLITDADVAVAGGVVPLDNNRKILPEFLPDNIMSGLTYGGIFNATTRVVRLTPQAKSILGVSSDTMLLQNSSTVPEGYPANISLFYITTTGGTFADMTFANGDWLISLGTEWRQLASGNQVSSVNSRTGAVVLDSDDIVEGVANLYMTVAERTKLRDIETGATRDTSVLIGASVSSDGEGTSTLTLTNKNGTVTQFVGSEQDLTDYLKKTGNSAQTYSAYSASSSRQAFSGSETETVFRGKVVSWLQQLESVAFTADYDDLADKPTYNGVTLEGDMVASLLGTLDVEKVSSIPGAPVANTLYVVVDSSGPTTTVDFYVMLDTLYHIETGGVVDYDDLTGKPEIDGNEIVSGDQTHESLGLVGVADFVNTPTGKSSGIEFVLGEGTPTNPVVLSEIDDTDSMRYSTVHTSSNHYINGRLNALADTLAGKLNMLFVNTLPDPPERNTQYYVSTATAGVWHIYVVDNVGTVQDLGTTQIDVSDFVGKTRKVAGIMLDADISAAQVVNATKDETATLTNKSINAEDNTLTNLEVGALKTGVLQTTMPASPTDAQLVTAKLVNDLTKLDAVTGSSAVTLQTGTPVTAISFNSYAITQILKIGKLCVFSTHLTFSKSASSAQWITLGTIASGYRPKRNTVFSGSIWTGTTYGIGGHIETDGDIRWWCDGAGLEALTSRQIRIVCIYECA
jgi:hypothetical protein